MPPLCSPWLTSPKPAVHKSYCHALRLHEEPGTCPQQLSLDVLSVVAPRLRVINQAFLRVSVTPKQQRSRHEAIKNPSCHQAETKIQSDILSMPFSGRLIVLTTWCFLLVGFVQANKGFYVQFVFSRTNDAIFPC